MDKRPPLQAVTGAADSPLFLPDCTFHIGEGDSAHIGQFPNLRLMAFYAIGKAPVPMADGEVDTLGMGPFALGFLIGDAHLKLMRPVPISPEQWVSCADAGDIASIIDLGLPLSPKADATRAAFLYRVGEFADIALHQPSRLPEIIDRIDALTNARLTERAQAILQTGIDPGMADLWPCAMNGWV